jgi:hypothetical protein
LLHKLRKAALAVSQQHRRLFSTMGSWSANMPLIYSSNAPP